MELRIVFVPILVGLLPAAVKNCQNAASINNVEISDTKFGG